MSDEYIIKIYLIVAVILAVVTVCLFWMRESGGGYLALVILGLNIFRLHEHISENT